METYKKYEKRIGKRLMKLAKTWAKSNDLSRKDKVKTIENMKGRKKIDGSAACDTVRDQNERAEKNSFVKYNYNMNFNIKKG